ncbi:MAG: bifunctional DNA-formamidopyrimidine glycosylase/DNA-(apurinic or apyrimidinic site) lyase [Bdellovibrionota bacterium]
MPELQEVEAVRTSLEQAIPSGTIIQKVVLHRKDLPFLFPKNYRLLCKATHSIFSSKSQVFVMGPRRTYLDQSLRHDRHLAIGTRQQTFSCMIMLTSPLSVQDILFRDPRRFGYMDIAARRQEEKNIYIQHLGPEPLSHQFTGDYLWQLTEKRTAPIKNVIMDQRIVVGVGNIYACEALYLTGIRPTMGAHKLNKVGAKNLVKHIQNILVRAIKAGGSTISDFKQAQEQSGYFQMQFHVYGKKDLPCATCGTKIKNKTLAGRSSFYCEMSKIRYAHASK